MCLFCIEQSRQVCELPRNRLEVWAKEQAKVLKERIAMRESYQNSPDDAAYLDKLKEELRTLARII